MALMAGRGSGAGVGMGRRTTAVELDIRRISRDVSACGCMPKLQRQKKSKGKILKERIRQFSIWYFENEDQKEIEHVRRRLQRKKRRKTVAKIRELRYLRWLYFLDGAIWTLGLLFTLCSTVETIGENTPFYEEKEKYRVAGPLIIVLAMVILFLLSVFKRKFLKANEMNKPKTSFYVLPKKRRKCDRKTDGYDTDDSGNVEDIETDASPDKFWTTDECNNHGHDTTTKERREKKINISEGISETSYPEHFHIFGVTTSFCNNTDDMTRADKRKAWAKSKWMRMDISVESTDTLEEDPAVQEAANREAKYTLNKGQDSLERRPILASLSTDSDFDTTSVLNNDEQLTQLKRDFSTKSKVSEVSNFSNFSESAPLIK